MDAFTTLTAVAVPLDQANIDTDQIIPARFLGKLRPQQVEGYFHDYRLDPNGRPREGVTLNNPAYENAKIIVANYNFACGSSRENAVTVMVDNGFRAFIAPSFGDIFYGNCFQNGLLAITLALADVEELMRQAESAPVPTFTVDLRTSLISAPDAQQFAFEVGDYHREALLNGIDEIDLTMSRLDAVEAYETRYYRVRPWLAPIASGS